MRIVKDKDGSERILTEDEYRSFQSNQAFLDFASEGLSMAHAHGGIAMVINVLLFGLCALLYLIGAFGGYFFEREEMFTSGLLAPILPTIMIWHVIRKRPWIAVLLQVAILVGIFFALLAPKT